MTAAERDKRTNMFQHLVLNALWVIILCLFGQRGWACKPATNLRCSLLAFGDLYGNQGEGAAEHRRETTYCGKPLMPTDGDPL